MPHITHIRRLANRLVGMTIAVAYLVIEAAPWLRS